MDRRLKHWEMALILGVLAAAILGSWLGWEQQALAERVIRLHVIANSDSQEDQELKLAVRDRVLAQVQELYPEGAGLEEVKEALEGHLNLWPPPGGRRWRRRAETSPSPRSSPTAGSLRRSMGASRSLPGTIPPSG